MIDGSSNGEDSANGGGGICAKGKANNKQQRPLSVTFYIALLMTVNVGECQENGELHKL